MAEQNNQIKSDCIVIIKTDKFKVPFRVVGFDEERKDLTILRFVHPNREVMITLPLSALIYQGENYTDYQANYITTERK